MMIDLMTGFLAGVSFGLLVFLIITILKFHIDEKAKEIISEIKKTKK